MPCGFGNGNVVYRSYPHHELLPLGEVRNFPTSKKKNYIPHTMEFCQFIWKYLLHFCEKPRVRSDAPTQAQLSVYKHH